MLRRGSRFFVSLSIFDIRTRDGAGAGRRNAIAKYREVMGATDPANSSGELFARRTQNRSAKIVPWVRRARAAEREIAQFFSENEVVG